VTRSVISIPLRQVLEWSDFRAKKPSRREGLCIFSDGVIHRVGWWSDSDQLLLVPNADGTNGVMPHDDILVWAALPNIMADIRGHFTGMAAG